MILDIGTRPAESEAVKDDLFPIMMTFYVDRSRCTALKCERIIVGDSLAHLKETLN